MTTLRIHDNGIDRDMTAKEMTEYKANSERIAEDIAAQNAAIETIAAAKISARAKLKTLGLTDAEIAALGA